jgi:hypothetical protein
VSDAAQHQHQQQQQQQHFGESRILGSKAAARSVS